jgi:HTH-type transcriptional regulator / antitoxin HipB
LPDVDNAKVSTYGDMEVRVEIRSPADLGSTVRGRRTELRLTQADVAEAAGVSRAWLIDLEKGKPTVELSRVLGVLDALGLTVDLRPADSTSPDSPSALTEAAVDLDVLLREYHEGLRRSRPLMASELPTKPADGERTRH